MLQRAPLRRPNSRERSSALHGRAGSVRRTMPGISRVHQSRLVNCSLPRRPWHAERIRGLGCGQSCCARPYSSSTAPSPRSAPRGRPRAVWPSMFRKGRRKFRSTRIPSTGSSSPTGPASWRGCSLPVRRRLPQSARLPGPHVHTASSRQARRQSCRTSRFRGGISGRPRGSECLNSADGIRVT